VGYALHVLPVGTEVPWHRVVNAGGTVSLHSDPTLRAIQRHLLECEGVRFSGERIPLDEFGWARDGGGPHES
jgi:methylated-DNA-protein-cysteine methyltransferase-like protein